MLRESATQQDRAASIEIPWRVREVKPLDGYRLWVVFADGRAGIVDLRRLITSENAGVFAALRDQDVFLSVFIDDGTVAWPGDIDLAPDAMHAAISERGEWIVE